MKTNTFSRRRFLGQTLKATAAFSIVPRFVLGGPGYQAPSDQLTLGFIGTGKQGRGLVNGFAKKAQVLAASDVDAQKLELFKTNTEKLYAAARDQSSYKGFTPYADFREMLERKDIDAIVVATPDHWHAVASIMAADAKKHVYCEKPLAHTIEEGRAMVNAIKRNKVVLQTGSMQRSSKNFRTACELVRNGRLGDIKEVLVSVGKAAVPCDLASQDIPATLDWDKWLGPANNRSFNAELSPPVEKDIFPNWRLYKEFGGGMLSDWGAHMFDIAQWGLNRDHTGPVKFLPPDGKDFTVLTMEYDDGIMLKHEDFGRDYGVRFIGTKGKLDVSRSYLDSDPGNIAQAEIGSGEIHLYESDDHQMDWLDAIKQNTAPICDAETGHRSSSVCCLANIAYWLGRPLVWDPAGEKFRNDAEADLLLQAKLRDPWTIS